MNTALTIAAVVTFCLGGLFVAVLRRLTSPTRCLDFDPEWLSGFSMKKYRPMERLLSENDYEFLATQKGYHPKIAKRLRSERRKIFRGYLRYLRNDFDRLEAALRLLLVNSSVDRPDLAKQILKQRLMFTYGILAVECRLALHRLGVGKVEIRGLLGSLDTMNTQLGELAMAGHATRI